MPRPHRAKVGDRTATARSARPPSHATIIACIALVCTLVIGLDAWRTWTARSNDIAAEKVDTANLTRSLAQHAHDMFDTADTLVVNMREKVETEGASPTQRDHLRQVIARQVATVPIVRDLMVFDAEGNRLVNSGRPAPAIENILDRAYFQYHAANRDRGVHLGDPIRGKLDGTWIISLSRRVDSPNGEFNGVVAATFSINAIREFYKTFDVGKEGFIGLNTIRGVIVTRFPADDAQIGRNIGPSTVFLNKMTTTPVDNWQVISPLDGIEHLGSYRVVDSYPLVVVVGRGVDEVLAPWRTDALFHLAISLGTSAIIALLGVYVTRQLRRQYEAERDLHRSERQYRLLADNNTDLIVQLDPDLRHVYASPASQRLLGYTPQELTGVHTRNLVHPDDWPAVAANLSTIAQNGIAPPISYRARRSDGVEIWVEAAGRRLDTGDGMILVKRDITQRKSAEAQLRQAQRMEAVGQLTAGVAHDFNNLLQAQLGALELLLDDVTDRPKATRFATMALGAAEHAAKLTHSLLSFSRQQVLDPEPVAVPALLARLETILSRTLGPRISLQLDIEDNLAALFADPAQLEAALLNLALNARDAMPEGGCLSIQACNAQTALDPPDDLEPGKHLLIAVSDDGTGMDSDTLAQACEPFFTTKGVGKGSGLGLSMVQGFARQSGGALRFRSALGHGTRIELWLPTATIQVAATPAHPVARAHGTGRILLVDDVMEVLVIMTEMLQSAGFDVTPVTSGEAAMEQLATNQLFDALVTDFAMPGIDGGELARRAQQLHPSLPTIIITGFAESEKVLTLPADAVVLRKPISGDTLANRICDLLEAAAKTRDPLPTQRLSMQSGD